MLDVEQLMREKPILALWHKILAEVRLLDRGEAVRATLRQYEEVGSRVNLPGFKMPELTRLKTRLTALSRDLGHQTTLPILEAWLHSH